MAKNFVQPGATIDHVATAAIVSGQVVVLKHLIGVALGNAAIGQSVAVAIEGVFSGLPKVSAAVFVVGEKLIWDTSAGAFDDSAATAGAGDITGAVVATVAGAAAELTCTVKLTPGNATLT